MKQRVFLFDLDSTVTTAEILPTIAKKIDREVEMRDLTEKTMMGEIGFVESFTARVDILKDIDVNVVSRMISDISLSDKIVNFLKANNSRCYIVTSNLDVWIDELMQKIGMGDNYFSSSAVVCDNKIQKINHVLRKDEVVSKFKDYEVVAVGDGSNDRKMLESADISIAYGGVRDVAPVLLEVADYAFYNEDKLCEFLNRLV